MHNREDYNSDCYFYHEDQDMGATIPCCTWNKGPGYGMAARECKRYRYKCPGYIPKKAVNEIIYRILKVLKGGE